MTVQVTSTPKDGSAFKLTFDRIPKVDYDCQTVSFPMFQGSAVIVPTPFIDVKKPGDKATLGTLDIQFLLDEDLTNYMEIFEWMRKLYFPESHSEYRELAADDDKRFREEASDAILEITSNQNKVSKSFQVWGAFPVSLTDLNFDSTLSNFNEITISASFELTMIKMREDDWSVEV